MFARLITSAAALCVASCSAYTLAARPGADSSLSPGSATLQKNICYRVTKLTAETKRNRGYHVPFFKEGAIILKLYLDTGEVLISVRINNPHEASTSYGWARLFRAGRYVRYIDSHGSTIASSDSDFTVVAKDILDMAIVVLPAGDAKDVLTPILQQIDAADAWGRTTFTKLNEAYKPIVVEKTVNYELTAPSLAEVEQELRWPGRRGPELRLSLRSTNGTAAADFIFTLTDCHTRSSWIDSVVRDGHYLGGRFGKIRLSLPEQDARELWGAADSSVFANEEYPREEDYY